VVAIGLILLVLALVLAVGIVVGNDASTDISVFGLEVSGLTQGTLFLVGAATALVVALALALMVGGLKRRRTKALAHKRQVQTARSDADTLAEENARLQDELARKAAASKAVPPASVEQSAAHGPGSAGHDAQK